MTASVRAVARWPGAPTGWLAFERPFDRLRADCPAEVPALLGRVERAAGEGAWAVGFVEYEAAPAFDPAFSTLPAARGEPLAWFALFDSPKPFHFAPAAAGRVKSTIWHPEISAQEYLERVRRIHQWIARGETYQANLTYRLEGELPSTMAGPAGDPWPLFAALYTTQPVDYACYLDRGEQVIASASPELFFDLDGDRVVCRPMKGTRPRGRTTEEDDLAAAELRGSPKERAENLMIVDMVRNDLGRIAAAGSVEVESLFDVERYATVWQMTSQVAARTAAGLPDLFAALFPSASVTGAPKIRTLELLSELETSPRGVYTGAVGVVAPGRRCRFNVAIRTVSVDRATGLARYGVGSGIVWDSIAERELEECRIKAVTLARPRPPFCLLETLLFDGEAGYRLLDRHLDRLADSAAYFGYPLDPEQVQGRLESEAQRFRRRPYRVRLLLSADGALTLESEELAPIAEPWRVEIAAGPVDPGNPFLFHKTTQREVYDRLRGRASPGVDDILLWNPDGEVTESTVANVAVRRGGVWWTPPVECGLLAGTLRAELLERGELREARIALSELPAAEEVRLLNSVRGWVRIELNDPRTATSRSSATERR